MDKKITCEVLIIPKGNGLLGALILSVPNQNNHLKLELNLK
jgi:hypothetical protein